MKVGEALDLRDYQLDALEALREKMRAGLRKLVLVAPTGAGKCLGIGTPVLMFDGRIQPVEEIVAGDILMGSEGRPRHVLSTCRDRGPLYRITPVKGTPWVCNDVHVLTLVNTETGAIVDIDLQTYLAKSKWWRHCHKQFAPEQGVDFAGGREVQIDPYFLGVWFGDGSKRLDRVAVSKPDPEIKELMTQTAQAWGLRMRTETSSGMCPTYLITGERGAGNPLLVAMRSLLVGNPCVIPAAIRTAPRAQRQAFLAGVVDTDGHVDHGGAEIVQKHPGISNGIAFIARSLGLKVTSSKKIVNGEAYQRLYLSGDLSVLPMRIPRKQVAARKQKKVATRTGFSVEAIGDGEYAGFELDGDGRFLLGDFTVTHNTVIGAAMIKNAVQFGHPVLFLAHRRELVLQAVDKLQRNRIDAGVIMAGEPASSSPVQVASVQTLARRPKPPAKLVVVDECHHSTSTSWRTLIEAYPEAWIIGLTATPWRSDRVGLKDIYEGSVVAATPAQLIAGGSLCQYEAFAYDAPDLHNVKVRAGEYQAEDLALACNTSVLVGNVVKEYLAHTPGKRSLVFAVNVEHSRALVGQFNDQGVPALHVDYQTPAAERARAIEELRAGRVLVLSSVSLFSEGFDLPSVEVISLTRPTLSLSFHLQMCGRGMRPAPGKSHLIIHDHAGNLLRHGLPDEERDYSLTATPKRIAELHCCPFCRQVFGSPGDDGSCPKCGEIIAPPREVREENERRRKEQVEGERLNKERIEELRKQRANAVPESKKILYYLQLQAEARSKKYKPTWAGVRFKVRYGFWPKFSAEQIAKAKAEQEKRAADLLEVR